jgi:integrase
VPSATTVHHYRATLAAALEDNRHWHNDQVPNPSRVVGNVPALDAEEVITLNADEARALVMACEASTDMRAQVVAFALFMGMRPGEVYGLRRRDVDRNGGFILVRQTVGKLRKGGVTVQENHAKNRNSMAPVELNDGAAAALVRAAAVQSDQLKLAGSAWQDHNLVFTSSTGEPLDEQDVRRYFYKLLQQAGVTRVKLKDLRHTHATLLLLDDVHPKLVSQRLRHSRISTTLDTYSHVTRPMRSGTATRFDRLIAGQGTADAIPHFSPKPFATKPNS